MHIGRFDFLHNFGQQFEFFPSSITAAHETLITSELQEAGSRKIFCLTSLQCKILVPLECAIKIKKVKTVGQTNVKDVDFCKFEAEVSQSEE